MFQRMQWLLAGRTFEMEGAAADETVKAGSTHVWTFVNQANGMGMRAAHPIHMHGRQFRVLDRTGGSATSVLRDGIADAGWTDTVLVLPGEKRCACRSPSPPIRGRTSITATFSNTRTWA
jgi:FtsP/CotA-like multicopper oxidase with cupredoxin domain